MLHRYEALMLAVPEITQDEARTIETTLEKAIKDEKGAFIGFERWGKYRLAYPVRKNDYGVYFLTRFEAPEGSNVLDEVKTLFAIKLHDVVIRSVVTKLSDEGSLEYQRPKSLEESPSRDVNTFLKENKMDGLLKKRPAKESAPKAESADAKEAAPVEAAAETPAEQAPEATLAQDSSTEETK